VPIGGVKYNLLSGSLNSNFADYTVKTISQHIIWGGERKQKLTKVVSHISHLEFKAVMMLPEITAQAPRR